MSIVSSKANNVGIVGIGELTLNISNDDIAQKVKNVTTFFDNGHFTSLYHGM